MSNQFYRAKHLGPSIRNRRGQDLKVDGGAEPRHAPLAIGSHPKAFIPGKSRRGVATVGRDGSMQDHIRGFRAPKLPARRQQVRPKDFLLTTSNIEAQANYTKGCFFYSRQ